MRRSLTWGLGLSVLLSVAALWMDKPAQLAATVEPHVRERDAAYAQVAGYGSTTSDATALPALSASWSPPMLEPAKRDLFSPLAAAPAPVPPPIAPMPVPVAAPAPPPIPDVRYRFLGQMVTPQGERLVYLGQGEQAVPIKQGDRLEDGFVVDSIDEDGVHLLYPAAQQRVVVPIPATAR